MHMTLPHFVQSLGDAPSLHSVAGGCSPTLFSRWRDASSLCSVAGGMLPHFVQSLGGCSLASLSHWRMLRHFIQSLGVLLTSLHHWGDAPLLRSVAGGMLPRFTQSLGGHSLASLSRWGMLPCFDQSLSIHWFHQIAPKFTFLRASRATLLRLGASLWAPP